MAEEAQGDKFVACGKTGTQVRKRRRDGWTRRRREIFLDHLRATSNVTASAEAAGMTEGSAYKLRARDPEFAEQWDEAIRDAHVRLTGKIIVYAETGGKPPPAREDGEPAEAPIEDFDPDLAMRLLAHHRQTMAGGRRGGGPRPRSASKEEFVQAAMKLLAMVERRPARRA